MDKTQVAILAVLLFGVITVVLLLAGVNVFSVLWFIFAIVLFAGVFAFAYFKLTEKPKLSPIKGLKENAVIAGLSNMPDTLTGARLQLTGDIDHSLIDAGEICGWCCVSRKSGFDIDYIKDKEGHVITDEHGVPKARLRADGKPIRIYHRYEDDIYSTRVRPDGTEEKHRIHKKGDVKTWLESRFLIRKPGLLQKIFPDYNIYFIPSHMHSPLAGNVRVKAFSFIPMPGIPDINVLNQFWNDEAYQAQLYDDVRSITLNMFMDETAELVQQGLNANPMLNAGIRLKDEFANPGDTQNNNTGGTNG